MDWVKSVVKSKGKIQNYAIMQPYLEAVNEDPKLTRKSVKKMESEISKKVVGIIEKMIHKPEAYKLDVTAHKQDKSTIIVDITIAGNDTVGSLTHNQVIHFSTTLTHEEVPAPKKTSRKKVVKEKK